MNNQNPTTSSTSKSPARLAGKSVLFTLEPVAAGNAATVEPEFIRFPDVQRIFGIKRGTCYQLINQGKIKSLCLRQRGSRTGTRLIYAQSVREYLHGLMEHQQQEQIFTSSKSAGECARAGEAKRRHI